MCLGANHRIPLSVYDLGVALLEKVVLSRLVLIFLLILLWICRFPLVAADFILDFCVSTFV